METSRKRGSADGTTPLSTVTVKKQRFDFKTTEDINKMSIKKVPNYNLFHFWLMRYVLETRKSNSELFPPKTFYLLLSGILRHARQVNTHAPNFLDKNNIKFQSLHAVLDNLFKELQRMVLQKTRNMLKSFPKRTKSKLWEIKVIGTENPKALLQAVFNLNGKNFCLRGGQEHRNLKLSQLVKCTSPSLHYLYLENSSKNNPVGLAHFKQEA